MINLRAALFDMDGVLIDSLNQHRESYIRYCEPLGVTLSKEWFDRELFGHQGPDILQKLFPDKYSPEERIEISRVVDGIFQGLIREEVVPVKGVQEFITHLNQSGIPLALGTSGSRGNVQAVLEALGLDNSFSAIMTETDVPRGKPDPAVYQLAAEKLRIPVEECVVFEDTPVGLTAAKNAGARCIALTTTTGRERLGIANAIIDDFRDLTWLDVKNILQDGKSTQ